MKVGRGGKGGEREDAGEKDILHLPIQSVVFSNFEMKKEKC